MYALKGGDDTVFLVSAFQESSFNREPFALRDKKILKFDREKADTLTLVKGGNAMELSRTGSDWRVVKPRGVAQRLQRRRRLHHPPVVRKHVDARGRERHGPREVRARQAVDDGDHRRRQRQDRAQRRQDGKRSDLREGRVAADRLHRGHDAADRSQQGASTTTARRSCSSSGRSPSRRCAPCWMRPAGPRPTRSRRWRRRSRATPRQLEGHARRRRQPHRRFGGDGRSAQQAGGAQGRVVRDRHHAQPASTNPRWWSAPASTMASSSGCGLVPSATTRMPCATAKPAWRQVETTSMRAAMQAFDMVTIPPSTDAKPAEKTDPKPPEKK